VPQRHHLRHNREPSVIMPSVRLSSGLPVTPEYSLTRALSVTWSVTWTAGSALGPLANAQRAAGLSILQYCRSLMLFTR
jgi:hypothetical protein